MEENDTLYVCAVPVCCGTNFAFHENSMKHPSTWRRFVYNEAYGFTLISVGPDHAFGRRRARRLRTRQWSGPVPDQREIMLIDSQSVLYLLIGGSMYDIAPSTYVRTCVSSDF
jgi:hypothetical protein